MHVHDERRIVIVSCLDATVKSEFVTILIALLLWLSNPCIPSAEKILCST